MSFKTGGLKTKYVYSDGYKHEEYIIYCAVESVTDTCLYKMFDKYGEEVDIIISAENDAEDVGKYSLIDCLYHLKHWTRESRIMKKKDHLSREIIINEMTNEEMQRIFGR